MKAEWRVVPLGDVASFVMGQAPPGAACNFDGVGTPFVKAGEFGSDRPIIREWTTDPKKFAKATDVLICVVGATCGKINLGADCAIGRSVAAIRPQLTALDQFFLHYFLEGQVLALRGGSLGAAQTVISKDMLAVLPIPFPPLDEQKRIVAVLDEAFEGLSRARANAEANLADAQELFGAVHKEALTRHAGRGRKVTMADVAEIASTLVNPKLPEYSSLPHVGAGNMPTCSDQLLDVQTAAEEGLTSGKFLFDRRMVLYSKIRPYLRKASRPDFDGLCSADVYPLLPKAGILERDYLFYLLLGPDFTEYAITGSARAGMPKVNREHLFKYSFELPDADRQRNIVALLDETLSKSRALGADYTSKQEALDILRQSLLQKAFSGELT